MKNDKQSNKKISLIIQIRKNILFLLVLIIDISELASWKFIKSALNNQVINAIDIDSVKHYSQFHIYILLIIISIVIFVFLPCFQSFIHLPKIDFHIHIFNSIFIFIFFLTNLHDFRDKHNTSLVESSSYYGEILRELLISKIDSKVEILNASDSLKNLFLVQLESYPYEFLENPEIAPNMNNFSKIYEFIGPIETVPYSTWTMGATVLLQTGIPQIMPDTNANFRDRYTNKYMLPFKGISDILKEAGYELRLASNSDLKVMGFQSWTKNRGYKQFLITDNDKDLFEYYLNGTLEKMDKKSRDPRNKNRFLSFIVNDETHALYWQPKWCNFSDFGRLHQKQKCFYCVDYLIGKFVRKFVELKMYEHTVLAIFPDHHPFISDFLWYNQDIKYLFVLFPGIEKVDSGHKLSNFTYYDFAPTILDLVGIKKYKPEFPFGTSIYDYKSNDNYNKHRVPDTTDLTIIYKFLHFERGRKK